MQIFLDFFKPNTAKILVFLLLSAYFLSEYSTGFRTLPISGGPPMTSETTVVGYPYVYFQKSTEYGMKFYADHFIKNIIYHYIFTCLLVAFLSYVIQVLRDGDTKQRSFFVIIMFVSVVGLSVLFQVFGGDYLIKVAKKEGKKSIQILLTLGVSADSLSSDGKWTPLIVAAYRNNTKLIQLLLKRRIKVNRINKFGRTALHVAVMRDSLDVAKILLGNGAEVNKIDYSQSMPIHYIKSYKMASLLLENDAVVGFRNKKGLTPIFFVPDERTMRLLIAKGAKLDIPSLSGMTVIDNVENPDLIMLLIKAGINVNSQNSKGETPLHRLIMSKHAKNRHTFRVIKSLVRKGADVDIRDKHGMSPLYYAIRKCNVESGKVFFRNSREVKEQSLLKDFTGKLRFIVRNNNKCWKLIASVRKPKPKSKPSPTAIFSPKLKPGPKASSDPAKPKVIVNPVVNSVPKPVIATPTEKPKIVNQERGVKINNNTPRTINQPKEPAPNVKPPR